MRGGDDGGVPGGFIADGCVRASPREASSIITAGQMELTMAELQDMAIRQQQQIDMNNEIIRAREERLKQLLVQYKNDKLCQRMANQCQISAETGRLRALKKSVAEYRVTIGNATGSDLDIVRLLCAEKEEEIQVVQDRINDLNGQIEHLRRVKHHIDSNDRTPNIREQSNDRFIPSNEAKQCTKEIIDQSAEDLDRLRQELIIRNRLNEQQAKKIASTKDIFSRKKQELIAIDKRLVHLSERLCGQNTPSVNMADITAYLNGTGDMSPFDSSSDKARSEPGNGLLDDSAGCSHNDDDAMRVYDNSLSSSLSGVFNLRPDEDKLNMHLNVMNSVKKRHSITDSDAGSTSMAGSHYVQIPISQLRARMEFASELVQDAEEAVLRAQGDPMRQCSELEEGTGQKSNGESPSIKASKRVKFDPLAILLDAAVEGELDLVIEASKQLRNPSQPNDEGITALHNAVCAGNFHCVDYLVKSGCDINYSDNDGWTPLHCAASCNNLMIIRFLVESGASIYARTGNDGEIAEDKCELDEEGYDECFDYLSSVREELGERNGGLVYALYCYRPERPDEIELSVNQALRVIRRGDESEQEWWWAEDCKSSKSGYVPRNYLALYPRVICTDTQPE